MNHRYLLAIPVFNEAKFLSAILQEAGKYIDDILVVNDGSTDATGEILAANPTITTITHPENRGYGQCLGGAFAFAGNHGYHWLITMDADFQHEPSFIPLFQELAETGRADLISGSRYLDGFDENDLPPADRRRINARITRILNDRLDLSITDAFCGFKAYRVSSLADIDVTVPGYAMPMQFWVQAVRAGMRIEELPIRLIYNDPTRHFGGMLDDPDARFAHYMEVFETEMAKKPATETGRARELWRRPEIRVSECSGQLLDSRSNGLGGLSRPICPDLSC